MERRELPGDKVIEGIREISVSPVRRRRSGISQKEARTMADLAIEKHGTVEIEKDGAVFRFTPLPQDRAEREVDIRL